MRRLVPVALVALAGCGGGGPPAHPKARTYQSNPPMRRSFPGTDVLVTSANFPTVARRFCHVAAGTTRTRLLRLFRVRPSMYLAGDRAPARIETWRISILKVGVTYHTDVVPPTVAFEATFDDRWRATRLRWGRRPSAPRIPCAADRTLR